MDNCTLVRRWIEMMNSFICGVSVGETTYNIPFVSGVTLVTLCSLWKHAPVNNSYDKAARLLFEHWARINIYCRGFHTCSPLGPGSPRPPCHAQDKSINWLNSCCRTKKARDILFVHTRGSRSAVCCWALISLQPLKTINLKRDLNGHVAFFSYPLSFLPGQARRTGETGETGVTFGSLWQTNMHIWWVEAGLWHLFFNGSNISS